MDELQKKIKSERQKEYYKNHKEKWNAYQRKYYKNLSYDQKQKRQIQQKEWKFKNGLYCDIECDICGKVLTVGYINKHYEKHYKDVIIF